MKEFINLIFLLVAFLLKPLTFYRQGVGSLDTSFDDDGKRPYEPGILHDNSYDNMMYQDTGMFILASVNLKP